RIWSSASPGRDPGGDVPGDRGAEDVLAGGIHGRSLIYVHETTASGRATRRASSDPACRSAKPPRAQAAAGGRESDGGSGRSGGAVRFGGAGSSPPLAPNGGNLTEPAPSGGPS